MWILTAVEESVAKPPRAKLGLKGVKIIQRLVARYQNASQDKRICQAQYKTVLI
jgi:hypothetical protein